MYVGVALILVNNVVGYGGLAACGVVAARTKEPRWLGVGAVCYAVSWVMVGIGGMLAGPEGFRMTKLLWLRAKRARKRAARRSAAAAKTPENTE